MGTVFTAYDEHHEAEEQRPVAVKVLSSAAPASVREAWKAMFEREAAAAAMLAASPFFMKVTSYDVGVDPAYLVMEHIDWPTLRQWLQLRAPEEGTPPEAAARIGIAILRGVETMHYHRIIHRDIKPENIFVRRNAQGDSYDVKICDLGVWTAESLGRAPVSGSRPRLISCSKLDTARVGTFSYMSPEQMECRPVGVRSDLHTIGSILWEVATGYAPYPMGAEGDRSERIRDRSQRLELLPERPASMPPVLYYILSKALEPDARDRFSSATEMKEALKAWLGDGRSIATVSSAEPTERPEARPERSQTIEGVSLVAAEVAVLSSRISHARGEPRLIAELEQQLARVRAALKDIARRMQEAAQLETTADPERCVRD
jgi:serine/threonine-protein kinase